MTGKSVLSKIATLLSIDTKEIQFTEAKAANGDILSSPTFDLDESVEVVSEDGTKSPAPDGEYEISLKDESGNENIIRIEVKDGKISERENVEEAKNAEDMEKKMDEEVVDKKAEEETHLADEKKGALTTDEAHALPETTDEDPRNRVGSDADDKKDPIISLSARMEELEAKMKDMMEKFQSAYPSEGQEVSSLEPSPVAMSKKDEELPKLDGAPVEGEVKFNLSGKITNPNKNNEGNYQNNFLSKLYK